MQTGDNPGLASKLLITQLRKHTYSTDYKPWIDAGYCIDAPNVLAAGSMYRDELEGEDFADWFPMQTMCMREPTLIIPQDDS